jgi:hypothetical protein
MSMRRLMACVTYGVGLVLTVSLVASQQGRMGMGEHGMPMGSNGTMAQTIGSMTKAQKIANAEAAAPTTISARATVLD